MALSGKDRRFLRGLGQHLDPVLQVGKEGLSEAFLVAVEQALSDHELIKIRVGESAPMDRREAADALAEATRAELAQVLGRTFLLYRADADEPRIALPSDGAKAGKTKTVARAGVKPASRDKAETAGDDPFAQAGDATEFERHVPAPVPKARSKRRSLPHRSSKKAMR